MQSTSRSDLARLTGLLAAMPPRFHVQSTRPSGAIGWSELLQPETIGVHIDAHAAARNIADPQIASSLFVQGIAMHLIGTSLAAEFAHGIALRATPDELWVIPGHPAVVWGIDGAVSDPIPTDARTTTLTDRVNAWIDHWVDGHFARLIDSVRGTVKVGRRMLEGNVASATGSSFVFLDWWERTDSIREIAAAVLAQQAISRHVSMTDVTVAGRNGLRSERSSCCLLLRVDGAHACPTCPMVAAEERVAITTQHVGHLLAIKPLGS